VHAHESTIAVFDQATGELTTKRVAGHPHELIERLMDIPVPARMVYEAGPTGYGLVRRARAVGIEMAVCAPGRTDRSPSDRIKTDKRDAIRLARRLAAGELTLVTIPSVEHERLRDVVRWLTSLRFSDRASQLTMADYLHAHDVLLARRATIETELEQLAGGSPWAATIARLRCLRGIDTLSALGLCAEIGQFDRFEHPDSVAAYLGIVPSEHTTGQQRRQGAITKAGSTHARRLLIEAAYHYQRQPGIGETLQRRQHGQPTEIINIAWRAQRRLNARWHQLKHTRKKANGIVAVAIARELAGFCWEIALA
jgi:transposase